MLLLFHPLLELEILRQGLLILKVLVCYLESPRRRDGGARLEYSHAHRKDRMRIEVFERLLTLKCCCGLEGRRLY